MLHLKNIIYINRNSYRSIYLQICDQLITLIKSGKLLPSTRLPGTRKLSEDLTLHRKTVIAAYAELEIQGWIETIPSKGTFVSKTLPIVKPEDLKFEDNTNKNILHTNFTFNRNQNLSNYSQKQNSNLPKLKVNDGSPDHRLAPLDELAKIEEGTEGSLTFLSNPKYTQYIYSTNASITIVDKSFEAETDIKTTLIRVEDAYKAFSKLLEYYNMVKMNKSGIEQPSFISDSAKYGDNLYLGAFSYLGENVSIGVNAKIYPNVYIGDNVTIGNNVIVFAGAKIYSETIIGDNCVIHSGAIVGADGFGFTPNEKGEYSKVPQTGNVIIEDNVDVGAGTTIDRATLGSTVIRRGVKLDNQIQIAHNVEIGEHTAIAAQTGIAGSTKIGKHCLIGGQVGIAGHLYIGNKVRIQAQSGIGRNIKDGETIQGSPALAYSDYNKSYVHFKNLPKIVDTIYKLEKKINKND